VNEIHQKQDDRLANNQIVRVFSWELDSNFLPELWSRQTVHVAWKDHAQSQMPSPYYSLTGGY